MKVQTGHRNKEAEVEWSSGGVDLRLWWFSGRLGSPTVHQGTGGVGVTAGRTGSDVWTGKETGVVERDGRSNVPTYGRSHRLDEKPLRGGLRTCNLTRTSGQQYKAKHSVSLLNNTNTQHTPSLSPSRVTPTKQ